MSELFNQPLYDATVQALFKNGVPMELAEAASKVVASDDPYQDNLGRSPQEQQVVNEAMTYFHKSLGANNG